MTRHVNESESRARQRHAINHRDAQARRYPEADPIPQPSTHGRSLTANVTSLLDRISADLRFNLQEA